MPPCSTPPLPCSQLAIQLGRLAAYATGLLMYDAPARMRWRLMIAVTLPFSVAALGMLGYIPETPRWLLANQRENEARAPPRARAHGRNTPCCVVRNTHCPPQQRGQPTARARDVICKHAPFKPQSFDTITHDAHR